LESVQSQLSTKIAKLTVIVDRVLQSPPYVVARGALAPSDGLPEAHLNSLGGHCCALQHRGKACVNMPPPGGGTDSGPKLSVTLNSDCGVSNVDASASAPHVELLAFEWENPKLSKRRCVEYFQRWGTLAELWVSYGSSQFTGAAATWLEAFVSTSLQATWAEFV
jgi:hypothetical protein